MHNWMMKIEPTTLAIIIYRNRNSFLYFNTKSLEEIVLYYFSEWTQT